MHLTPRERETLCAMEEGLSAKEIAGRLGIAERTVVEFRRAAMRKLNARTIAQLMVKWIYLEHQISPPAAVLDSFGRAKSAASAWHSS
jgi:DNA-binding CsgD family transcriptional regulator